MMIDTVEMRNLPWHIMQKHLADEAMSAGTYGTLRRQAQPHWRHLSSTNFWMNRIRKGLGENTPRR